jgi:hypothetical protein
MVEKCVVLLAGAKSIASLLVKVSTHDRLAVTLCHEVGSLLHRADAVRAAALREAMLPHTLTAVCLGSVRVLTLRVERSRRARLLIAGGILLSRSLREPIVIPCVGRSRARHAVLWCTISRIRRSKWCVPRVVRPSSLARAVVVLLGLERLVSLVLGDLVLDVARLGRLSVMAVVASKLSVNSRHNRSEPITASLCSLTLLHVLPLAPVLQPCLVVLAEIQVDVKTPAHSLDPVKFKAVQLHDRDAAHLGPGSILECVVVEELAPQQEGDGEVTPNLTFRSLVRSLALHTVDPLGKVVHAEKDGRARQSRGGEDLRHKLPERRRDVAIRRDDSRRHLGHILSHQLDLIVEDGTYTSGHFSG